MSLKSMLQGKSDEDRQFQEIVRRIIPEKASFKTFSDNMAFSNYRLLCPYRLKNSYEASLVGTAFDYLARAMIAQVICENKEYAVLELKALAGLNKVKYLDRNIYKAFQIKYINVLTDFIDYIYSDNSLLPDEIFNKCCQEEFKAWCAYLDKSALSRFKPIEDIKQLIPGACFFAKLEILYRSSGSLSKDDVDKFMSELNDEIILDLENMCELFSEKFIDIGLIQHNSLVIFNPSFGLGSACCNGADADIYIDGTLYDFKSSKRTGYIWQEIAQMVMYYYLNIIAGCGEKCPIPAQLKNYRVLNIAFYRARYGEIEYCSTDFLQTKKAEEVLEEISNHLISRFEHLM